MPILVYLINNLMATDHVVTWKYGIMAKLVTQHLHRKLILLIQAKPYCIELKLQ